MGAAVTLSGSLLLLGCTTTLQADTPSERLMSRFSELWPDSTYMISTVETPQGLWNVYVVSIPPNQVAIRQSRQDGEYEFGMVDDQLWHIAYGKAEPTRLGPEWAWFIRNHEIFRFSEWIRTIRFDALPDSGETTEPERSCQKVQGRDRFDLAVTLCLDSAGDPVWIERSTPPVYGDTTVRFEIEEWADYLGRRFMKKFRQVQGTQVFEWEVQGLLDVPADQEVQPPPGISND